jgi:hypothetical protein
VSAAFSSELPVWVTKHDGRLVPFEADEICQALFAASEMLGRPDAFLARELTDGVLHFLGQEYAGSTPSTAHIAEWVVKVVRELGHPDLARAFALHAERDRQRAASEVGHTTDEAVRFNPREPFGAFVKRCRQEYGLRAVFSRDLLAAHSDGLLTLSGLDTPLEMSGGVFEPLADSRSAGGLLEALSQVREVAGNVVAIDSPDYAVADDPNPASAARLYARSLTLGLKLTGLRALVHMNGASAPPWADTLAVGPLFAEPQRPATEALRQAREALVEELLAEEQTEIHWHIAAGDFSNPENGGGLQRLARAAVDNPRLTLAFDRPRRIFALGEGMDRKHPTVLLNVGIHLPKLAEMPGITGSNFTSKLGSLARLAVSAAVQKRDYLRRTNRQRPALTGRFLLDRARLVVTPVGLDAVVRTLSGSALTSGKPAVDTARRIVQSLQDDLGVAGRTYRLECCVDEGGGLGKHCEDARAVAGVTGWDPSASWRAQLRAAGPLHAAVQGGTALIVLPSERVLGGADLLDLLRYAWEKTEVARLRFVRPALRPLPLTLLHS